MPTIPLRASRAESRRSPRPALVVSAAACSLLAACAATHGSGSHLGRTPSPRGVVPTDGFPAAPAVAESARSIEEPLPADLRALVRAALEVSPAVRAARARYEAACERRGAQVGSLPDPRLRGRAFLEEVETRVGPQEWSVGIEQQFPALGVLGAMRRTADARARVEASRLGAALLAVAREVELAWYELYYLEQAILTMREDRDRLRSLEEVVRRGFSSGTAPYTDLIRAQVELGRTENRLAGLEDRRRPARARLNSALHREVDAPLPTPRELREPGALLPPEELARRMQSSNPELAGLLHEQAASEEELAGADLERRPGFSLGLEYIETGDARTSGVPGGAVDPLIATLSIDLPVHGARYDAARREARAERRAVSFRLEQALDRLRSELEHEHFLARDAARQIGLYQDTLVPRAVQAFEATETDFRGGQAGFLELIDAERVLLELELSLQRARTDRALAHARLESLVGEPVTDPSRPIGAANTLEPEESTR